MGLPGGGGYDLVLEVFDADGVPLPRGRVRLGGGAAAKSQPRLLREAGFSRHGPQLDDTALLSREAGGNQIDALPIDRAQLRRSALSSSAPNFRTRTRRRGPR